MQDPLRVLKKILICPAEPFAETGEPLEIWIEWLRELQKIRKARRWMLDHAGFDIAITPEVLRDLLEIPEIDRVETHSRDLEARVDSQKAARADGDPVGAGNLNAVLRELHRESARLADLRRRDFSSPPPALAGSIRAEHIGPLEEWIGVLRRLKWSGWGYVVAVVRAATLEKRFRALFPNPPQAHPLRNTWPMIEREVVFYRACGELQERWRGLKVDVFRLVREDTMEQFVRNLEEIGNGLWSLVYKRPAVSACIELAKMDFADIRTFFDNPNLPPV